MTSLQLWLWCVAGAALGSVVTFWGLGGLWHWWYYRHRRADAEQWKLQPKRWLSPALGKSAFRLGSFNIFFGSLVAGTFTWHVRQGGWSALYTDLGQHGYVYLALSVVIYFLLVDAGLYYSHRLLHHRRLFRHIHRWHHRYVAPTVFTTTAMHPVEFAVFMAVLLIPVLIIPVHVGVYLFIVGYSYLVGMIDHSGIKAPFALPFHRNNHFHDDHHVYFHCNYGHHTQLFDRLHGTVRKIDRHYDEQTFHDGHDGHDGRDAHRAHDDKEAPHVGLPDVP